MGNDRGREAEGKEIEQRLKECALSSIRRVRYRIKYRAGHVVSINYRSQTSSACSTGRIAMAVNYFQHHVEWRVIVCKECRHAVWPGQVVGHLTGKQHRMAKRDAERFADEVQQWPGVAQYPSEFEAPRYVQQSIHGMPVYTDGVKCEMDAGKYAYVCRSVDVMKEHWRKIHQHSVGQSRGGSGIDRKEDVERQVRSGCRKVSCQRFFPQGAHSQYFAL